MVLFNYATKEITAKIVYYGPGLCGKTTNLQFIFDSLPTTNKSKMLSLATKTDRTLFFDFLPLDLGKIRGMRTKLQLYTVPGQVYYNSTRQLVLKGADGIVFVADSQDIAVDANLESFQNLEDNLKRQGIRIREIPLVIQYNKRDLPNAASVTEIEREINKLHSPHFESVATTGLGVEETLRGVTLLVLSHLVKKYGLEGSGPLDLQILNPPADSRSAPEEVWDESDDAPLLPPPSAAASQLYSPEGEQEFDIDDSTGDETVPLIPTELVGGPEQDPFDDLDGFGASTEVPMASIEIPLPPAVFASLAAPTSPVPVLEREVTIPLNLSLDEIRQHKRLRLKITLDVNLLP